MSAGMRLDMGWKKMGAAAAPPSTWPAGQLGNAVNFCRLRLASKPVLLRSPFIGESGLMVSMDAFLKL